MLWQPTDFDPWLDTLVRVAGARRWRYLLVLSGARDWSRILCESSSRLRSGSSLWVCDPRREDRWSIAPASATSMLGSETGHIVYDAWSGLHPNGFGALAGTVRAGGLLVLLTPPMSQWPQYQDPDYQRLAVAGFNVGPRAMFLEHCARTLQQHAQTLLVYEDRPLPALPSMPDPAVEVEALAHSDCRSRDQLAAVAAIEHVVSGHRDRPLVLTADRGRGKSAALGIAAARLLSRELDYIVLTAPLANNIQTVFKHTLQLLAGAEQRGNILEWRGRRLEFIPPDELLRRTPPARLLLVDEAAAIPAPLLSQMLDHYHRVVFTTTVHGYEGTGRGFAVRFQRELQRRRPHWQQLTLDEPVRWAANDPLEQVVGQLLWLDAEALPDQQLQSVDRDKIALEFIERSLLLQQPALMSQLVGLLTLAHYRSTPDDFRLLLDAPNMSLLLARRGDQLAGAVLVAREGSLQADLAANIRAGRRRPRGHLLPQTLYAQTGSDQLLARQCWRVVRIAVHPALQRRGLGLRMLEQLQQSASAARIDCLGSSFGATRELLAFWRRAHYVPVAIGVRRDASSGAHALLILQGLNAPMIALMESERARFAELMPAMLADPLQQLEPAVVAAVLAALAEPHYRLTPRDRADVRAFVSAARGYDYCQLALWKATLILLSDQRLRLQLDALQRGVLIARVLQKHSWAEVARRYGLTGRAQVLHCLRSAFDDAVGATP